GTVASYVDVGVTVGMPYTYSVVAYDAAGNASPASAVAGITAADTTPPSVPTNLTASLVGTTGAHLEWGASTDAIGVTDYVITRTGAGTASLHAGTATTYDDGGLDPTVKYT